MTKLIENTQYEIHMPPAATVSLLDWSAGGPIALATCVRGYTNKFSLDITPTEVIEQLDNIQRTKLSTPTEMIYYTFLIQDVTRAFTHQLVRYRIGTAFVQESLRFSVREKLRVLATEKVTNNQLALHAYEDAVDQCAASYYAGLRYVPTEDIRGILPTNILTAIFFSTSLKGLANIYTQRMCCQAQIGEWGLVLKQIKQLVRSIHPQLSVFLRPPTMNGKCGFQADFDRPCIYVGKTADEIEAIANASA